PLAVLLELVLVKLHEAVEVREELQGRDRAVLREPDVVATAPALGGVPLCIEAAVRLDRQPLLCPSRRARRSPSGAPALGACWHVSPHSALMRSTNCSIIRRRRSSRPFVYIVR